MPELENPRHERFAQLMAFASLPICEAYKQAGYGAKSAAFAGPRLAKHVQVTARIAELKREAEQAAGTRSIQAITRQELTELLGKIIRAGFGKPEKTGPHDALKASELLTKLRGWNEPDRSQVAHVHLQLDANLLQELRAGHAAGLARAGKPRLELVATVATPAGGESSSEGMHPPEEPESSGS